MVNCPFCSQQVQETARSCTHCGGWVDTNAKPDRPLTFRLSGDESKSEAQTDRKRRGVLAGLALLSVAIAIVLGNSTASWLLLGAVLVALLLPIGFLYLRK